jgi:hypothetical protein
MTGAVTLTAERPGLVPAEPLICRFTSSRIPSRGQKQLHAGQSALQEGSLEAPSTDACLTCGMSRLSASRQTSGRFVNTSVRCLQSSVMMETEEIRFRLTQNDTVDWVVDILVIINCDQSLLKSPFSAASLLMQPVLSTSPRSPRPQSPRMATRERSRSWRRGLPCSFERMTASTLRMGRRSRMAGVEG